jgi:undecaprenyl pyrophosphate phosphatase UppP
LSARATSAGSGAVGVGQVRSDESLLHPETTEREARPVSYHLTYLQAVVTGVVQGVTELFPVSSLGHNVLLPALIGGSWAKTLNVSATGSPYLAFIVGLHVATAVAMIAFFWRDWLRIVRGFFSSLGERRIVTPDQRLAWMIILGTIPVGIVGVVLQKEVTKVLAKPELAAVFLAINGVILLVSERMRRAREAREAGGAGVAAAAPRVAFDGPGGGPGYGYGPGGGSGYGPTGGPGHGPTGGPGHGPTGGPGHGPTGGPGYGYQQQPRQQQWQGPDPRYGQDDRQQQPPRGNGSGSGQYGGRHSGGGGQGGQYGRDQYGQGQWGGQQPAPGADPRDPRGGWGPRDSRDPRAPQGAGQQQPVGRHGGGAGRGPAAGDTEVDRAVAADRRLSTITLWRALTIGAAQILALLPGISRDGIVTVAGMGRGLRREDAVRFSFLLSAPVILAAGALKAGDLTGSASKGMHGPIIVGSIIAGIGAYVSIRFLTKYFSEDKSLNPFGYYCIIAGLGSLAYLVLK